MFGEVFGNFVLRRNGISEIEQTSRVDSRHGHSLVSPYQFFFHGRFPKARIPRLFPHSDGYIRTDFRAQGASGAFTIGLPFGKEVPMAIDFIPDTDKIMGTHQGTEATSLAPLLIDFDFCHISRPSIYLSLKYIIRLSSKVKGIGHGFGGLIDSCEFFLDKQCLIWVWVG